MTIQSIQIPKNLQDNSFIISLHKQSQDKLLTTNQLIALKDILGIEMDKPEYSTKSVKKYFQYFYRTDYHGDYLQDSEYAYDIPEELLEDKIQNMHAAQYGQEAYDNKYLFNSNIEIPNNITNISYFMIRFYDDYKKLEDKINRNKFRKLTSKNTAYRAMASIVQGDISLISESLIDKALGKAYKFGR